MARLKQLAWFSFVALAIGAALLDARAQGLADAGRPALAQRGASNDSRALDALP